MSDDFCGLCNKNGYVDEHASFLKRNIFCRTAHVTVVMVENRIQKPRPWTFASDEARVIDLEYVFLFLLIYSFFIFVL